MSGGHHSLNLLQIYPVHERVKHVARVTSTHGGGVANVLKANMSTIVIPTAMLLTHSLNSWKTSYRKAILDFVCI